MRPLLFSLLLLLTLLPSASGQTGGFGSFLPGPPKAVPSLLADTTAIAASTPFHVGIRFKLADGWHLYWRFPGDSGAAPQVKWTLPPGFEAGEIQWPLPHSLKSEGDIFTNVYEGEVLLPVEIRPPASLPKAPFIFQAQLKWYVCSETCLPGEGVLKIEGATSGQKVEVFPIPPSGATAQHPEVVSRTFRIPAPGAASNPEGWKALVVLEEPTGERRGWEVEGNVPVKKSPESKDQQTIPVEVAPIQTPSSQQIPPQSGGLGSILWAAFLGGLLLNLMPCVLPVIALKILGFTQQAGEDPKRVFQLGLAFCAGVFAFFSGLAVAVLGLKAAGSGLNWGFQFQNPWILTGLITAVFIFGLNLLGVFEITLGGDTSSKLGELSSRQGFGGAFLHGAFTTLLGTSCTAPYLGVTLGFAVSQPAGSVFAIFFTIA
ncbi:MAG: hypothetical protein EBR81_08130, partial [Proteobacteria bacterium]|nr:hypothetical protein [Pseudomonadota bacterium]